MAFNTRLSLAFLLLSIFFVSATLAIRSKGQDLQLQSCRQSCSYEEGERRQQCEEQCREWLREQGIQGQGQGGQGGGSSDSQGQQQGGQEDEEGQQQQQQNQNPFHFRAQRFSSKVGSEQGAIRVLPRFSHRSNLLQGIDNYRVAVVELNPSTFSIPDHWDADTVSFVVQGKGVVTTIEENNKQTRNLETGDIFRIRAGTTVYYVNKDNNQKLRIIKLVQPVSNAGRFETYFGAGGRNPESFFNTFSSDILQAAFNTRGQRVQQLFQSQRRGAFVKASHEQIQALTRRASSSRQLPWPLPPFDEQSQGTFNLFKKRPSHSNEYGSYYEVNQNDYQQLRELDLAVSYANIKRGSMFGPYYNTRATQVAVVLNGNGYTEMASPYQSSSRSGQQGRQGGSEEEEEGGSQGRQGRQGGSQGQQGRQGGSQGKQGGQGGRHEEQDGSQWGSQGGRQGRQGQQGGSGEEEEGEEGGSRSRSRHYQKVRAQLRQGDVLIVPAGHPIVTVASQNQDLQVMCFEINAQNNRKNPLAGKNNILNQLEREAKELAFNIPARQVDEILQRQQQSWFFPGPQQQQQQGGQGQGRV